MVNVYWSLQFEARSDFEPPYDGYLTYRDGQLVANFSLTVLKDQLLEGEERFAVTLTSVDNNADLSLDGHLSELVIQADPGSSGHIEIAAGYHHLLVGEPTALYNGQQVC